MKKSFCVFLASLLLLCLGVPLEAETNSELELPSTGIELIRNGDFEMDLNGEWISFGRTSGWENNDYTQIVDSAPLGKNGRCVKITDFLAKKEGKDEATVSNPYAKQELAVIPGATYALSAKIYSKTSASNTTGGKATIKLEFTKNGYTVVSSNLGDYKHTNGDWMDIEHSFTIPVDATGVRVMLRQQGVGHMYYDDISLKMTEAPNAIHIETDEVFYYADHPENGIATATLNVEAYPELSGKDVKFRLKKEAGEEDETVGSPYTVTSQNNCATFSFPVDNLEELQAEYYIEAQIDGYDDPRCTATWKVYRYNRPACLDEKGVYYWMQKNEETGELERTDMVVQPVFAYRYRSWQFLTGEPNGIIIAQLAMQQYKNGEYWPFEEQKEYLQGELEKAKANDMMCMIALYRKGEPAGSASNAEMTEQVVREFYNHEALFAWMVMDETFTNNADPFEDLRNSYKIIRDIDPYHPVYLNEATTRLVEAGRYADILCVDPYPASYQDVYDKNPKSPYSAAATFPGERVALAVKGVKGRKPVYSLLQAFRWEENHPDYFPSGDEMRNMLYQSLLSGASGVGYFKFANSDGDKHLNDTPVWDAITAFSLHEQKDAFDAFVYGEYPIISDVRKDAYWAVSFLKEDVLHMVVLNRLKTAQTISMSFANVAGSEIIPQKFSSVCVAGSEDEAQSSTGTLVCNLPPSGAALYKLTPEQGSFAAEADMSLYINYGKSSVLSPGTDMTAELYNNSGMPVRFALARYRAMEGAGESVEIDKMLLCETEEKTASFSFEVPDDNASYAAKAFVWSTESPIVPACFVKTA